MLANVTPYPVQYISLENKFTFPQKTAKVKNIRNLFLMYVKYRLQEELLVMHCLCVMNSALFCQISTIAIT